MKLRPAGSSLSDMMELTKLREAAEQGDTNAQYNLGQMYRKGNLHLKNGGWVPQDNSEAMRWFTRVAEQGDAEAQYTLGQMYKRDDNKLEAALWYRQAAERGHAGAQYELGLAYEKGQEKKVFSVGSCGGLRSVQNDVIHQDYEEAVHWYRLAAEQEGAELWNVQAQIHLGEMYSGGMGVAQNLLIAMRWFTRAADTDMRREKNQLRARELEWIARQRREAASRNIQFEPLQLKKV